jgi:glycosyltransferase involved in cell wall biosynthesis
MHTELTPSGPAVADPRGRAFTAALLALAVLPLAFVFYGALGVLLSGWAWLITAVVVTPVVLFEPLRPRAVRALLLYLLYVGRVEAVKGITTLVDAWEAARPDGFELLVIGDGDLREDLARRGVPGIHFAGSLPAEEVRRRMLRARALLFPTHLYEGQPMVTVEAFSAGLPVVASALGGNREVVGELGDRWLVDAADPRAWAVALTGLADDEAVDEAGATGRLLFEQRYGGKANVSPYGLTNTFFCFHESEGRFVA